MNKEIRDAIHDHVDYLVRQTPAAKKALFLHNKMIRELADTLTTEQTGEIEGAMWGMVFANSWAMFEWGMRIGQNPALLLDFGKESAES